MALLDSQKISRLFKKLLGVGETSTSRDFFEEPFSGRSAVLPTQIWQQAENIPATAPSDMINEEERDVLKRYIDLVLSPVPGASNAFYSEELKDTIPFNYDSSGSYNYVVKDNSDTTIPFGQYDWLLDTDAGVLYFYNGLPAALPPKISFYKYIGLKGAGGGTGNIDGGFSDSIYGGTPLIDGGSA